MQILDTESSLALIMLPLLKPKMSGADIALGFYDHLRKNRAEGFSKARDILPTTTAINSNAVLEEWLYLEIFSFDFSVYLALGKTPAKAAVLTPFWQHVEAWFQDEQVAALPERFAVVACDPHPIPAERSELSYARLLRRLQEYTSSVTSPHQLGPNSDVFFREDSVKGINVLSDNIERDSGWRRY